MGDLCEKTGQFHAVIGELQRARSNEVRGYTTGTKTALRFLALSRKQKEIIHGALPVVAQSSR